MYIVKLQVHCNHVFRVVCSSTFYHRTKCSALRAAWNVRSCIYDVIELRFVGGGGDRRCVLGAKPRPVSLPSGSKVLPLSSTSRGGKRGKHS